MSYSLESLFLEEMEPADGRFLMNYSFSALTACILELLWKWDDIASYKRSSLSRELLMKFGEFCFHYVVIVPQMPVPPFSSSSLIKSFSGVRRGGSSSEVIVSGLIVCHENPLCSFFLQGSLLFDDIFFILSPFFQSSFRNTCAFDSLDRSCY